MNRREFLKSIGAGVAAVTGLSALKPKRRPKNWFVVPASEVPGADKLRKAYGEMDFSVPDDFIEKLKKGRNEALQEVYDYPGYDEIEMPYNIVCHQRRRHGYIITYGT